MKLSELVKTHRNAPRRTWNIASSEHWYIQDNEQYWSDLITNSRVYREGMIETEERLIATISGEFAERPRPWYDTDARYHAFVALGPGDAKKEIRLCNAVAAGVFVPIDINKPELDQTVAAAQEIFVHPIHAEFRDGLAQVANNPKIGRKFVYLGSTYSNLDAFDYDLLAAIDESLKPGDAVYVSVQTCPSHRHLPLLVYQYDLSWGYPDLSQKMCSNIGVQASPSLVQFNPVRMNMEVISTALNVEGAAEEIGIKPGDTLLTMVSHKPPALRPELEARFGDRYAIRTWRTEQPVYVDNTTQVSVFEGAILTKR